ncbi:lambda exonuclease family protein [Stutzerimonas kunmingensis]|uniref:lambda exonuclease family protein n=1 Tax=Stutzerimonas kunmingensis TaxID=1211807 RepID=UPI002FCBBFF3
MSQRSPEWFAQRAGKFTGSRFADLMAVTKSGPSTSRRNLLATLAVERLTGACVETYSNAAMERGVALEEEARQAYEARIGDLCVEVDFIDHPTLPNVGISPDGLVGDDGLVEIKCPASMAKHLDALRTGAHADEYRWQVQGQLWVTGRAWCDVASYDPRFPEHLRLAVRRVERDEAAAAELEAACIKAEAEVLAMVNELNNMECAA